MYRRGLLVVLALEVLVGDRLDARLPVHLHPHAVLDALQAGERPLTLLDILILDQQRHLPVASVGDQRVIGVQLVLYAGFLEDLFDAQHFLDLIADRQLVLEQQREMLSQVNRARLLVLEYAGAKILAVPRVGFQRQQRLAGDGRHALFLYNP